MYREVWTHIDKETLKELGLSRVRFKGSSSKTTTTRVIPGQTTQEAALQNSLYDYSNTGINNAYNYQNKANSLLGSTVNPNWSGLTNNYNNTMANVSSGYNNLANGELPTSYTDNIQTQLNNMTTASVGNALSNLASRGVINSSQADTGFANIADSVSNAAASKYLDAINSYSNTLSSQANNAAGILSNNASAQQNSYYSPSQYFNYANNSTTPASNLFNTMYSGRMGTGSTTTSSNDGGSGTWQAVGTIGSALICFAAGTKIATPDGDKNIEDIKVGDKVYSLDDNNEKCVETVEYVKPPHDSPVWQITTEKGVCKPTNSQRFLTQYGFEYVEELRGDIITFDGDSVEVFCMKQLHPELVYDFTVTGRNIFFADGLASEGFD